METGRESADLEIHSQLFWAETASTAVGVFSYAQGPLEAARRRRRGAAGTGPAEQENPRKTA